ncbi:MAG TPA: molybdate ABC transporter substrate-binding protein [Rubrivivax sp.]|nr:molybdate ABC transporter substrate-binding protein [Rubrivivax sp.]
MVHDLLYTIVRWVSAALLLAAASSPALAQGLTVGTDSSLGEAMQAVARGFEAARPGVRVEWRVGAPGALLEQIAGGVPVDVLAGADAQTVAMGVQRRLLVPELRSVFASNALVLVVPASLNLPVRRLSDLARPEVVRIAMGREASVPAGRYAREAINAQRMWPAVQRKVVVGQDVREVLDLVAAAEVEAGFVFATDARTAADRVRVVETLPTTTPIRYLANVAVGSKNPALASEFVAYLRSDSARAVFERFGFGVP